MRPALGGRDDLPALGLAPAEQAAYELLIDRPSATLADLDAAWSRPEPLAGVLAVLEERSLASREPGPPTRFRAASPTLAFDALLADYAEQLDQVRRHIAVLDAAYQARPAVSDLASTIEVVTGPRAVRRRWDQLRRGARQHISRLVTPPYECGADPDGPDPDRVVRRDLTWRALYDRSAINRPEALAAVERSIRAGQLARVLPDLPASLWLVDAKVAVLPLRRDADAADGIIVVHPSALLDALVALFEGLWRRALPLHEPVPGDESSGRAGYRDGERRTRPDAPAQAARSPQTATTRPGGDADRLLTLLLSGLTDEAIARQLGLSHRTVQRRVATLMADLGAHSRFQAGVRAASRQTRGGPVD